jgi:hypothetical protein
MRQGLVENGAALEAMPESIFQRRLIDFFRLHCVCCTNR